MIAEPTPVPDIVELAAESVGAADPDLAASVAAAESARIALEEPPAAPPPVQLPPADVDAVTLIDAYEQRNARVSERIRQSIQARLLVATTQVDEAFKLAGTDSEIAGRLHARALEELERVRNLELRAIGQELHPALIRLGLPAALKALRKELADTVSVTLDVEAAADSLVETPGRALVPAGERLVLYRFALDAIRVLVDAGARRCVVSLHRRDGLLVLTVSASTSGPEAGHLDQDALAASTLAIEAHGGFTSLKRHGANVEIAAELAAPPIVPLPEGYLAAIEEVEWGDEDDEGDDAPPVVPEATEDDEGDDAGGSAETSLELAGAPGLHIVKLPPEPAAPPETPRSPLGSVPVEVIHLGLSLSSMANAPDGRMELSLDLDLLDGGDTLVPGLRATVLGLVEAIVAALEAAGAARCALSVRQAGGSILLSAISETDGSPFDAGPLKPYEAEVETFGGYVAVSRRDNAVSVTAEVMAVTIDGASAAAAPQTFAGLLDGEAADGHADEDAATQAS